MAEGKPDDKAEIEGILADLEAILSDKPPEAIRAPMPSEGGIAGIVAGLGDALKEAKAGAPPVLGPATAPQATPPVQPIPQQAMPPAAAPPPRPAMPPPAAAPPPVARPPAAMPPAVAMPPSPVAPAPAVPTAPVARPPAAAPPATTPPPVIAPTPKAPVPIALNVPPQTAAPAAVPPAAVPPVQAPPPKPTAPPAASPQHPKPTPITELLRDAAAPPPAAIPPAAQPPAQAVPPKPVSPPPAAAAPPPAPAPAAAPPAPAPLPAPAAVPPPAAAPGAVTIEETVPAEAPKDQVRRIAFLYTSGQPHPFVDFVRFVDALALQFSKKPLYLRKVFTAEVSPGDELAAVAEKIKAANAVGVVGVLPGIPDAKVRAIESAMTAANISYYWLTPEEAFKRPVVLGLVVELMLLNSE